MFIGKWNKSGGRLSVRQHTQDTGDVMDYLLHTVVPIQTIKASGCTEQDFRSVALFCALVHDIGKCTPAFQWKTENKEKLAASGFDPSYAEYTPHALAGGAILKMMFGVPDEIDDIIAAHHGKTREIGRQQNYSRQFHKYELNYFMSGQEHIYKDAWTEIYENAIDQSGLMLFPEIGIRAQILLTGLLIMADWIASNEVYFPLQAVSDQKQRVSAGLRKISLPPLWQPHYVHLSEADFIARFGFAPNQLQKSTIEAVEKAGGTGLLIIESTMGTGKTEAALAAAEVLSCMSGAGGVYFGLPTQATANGLFPRVTSWAGSVSEGMLSSIRLAHSDAWNNDYYRDLSISDSSGITVNQWLSGGHRTLLPDFVVGTVDQILMAGLRQKFFMLLHLGMSGKTVIIDEVHSYDAYMDSYLEVVLSWLGAYHAPVILLSATLTEEKRRDFIRAYSGREASERNQFYPAVTWADFNGDRVFPVAGAGESRTVSIRDIPENAIVQSVLDSVKDGGCAGVIVNTVDKAQELAEELRTRLEGRNRVLLIHSRFLPEDRAKIENEVQQYVGKSSDAGERDRMIIIGTQVLEQSLDIDFDVLFTEICPVDLLLQRIGRLHRHRIHDRSRPAQWNKPVCFVFHREKSGIYEPYIIRRTTEVLRNEIQMPSDIKPMIESVYDLRQGTEGEDKDKYRRDLQEMRIHAGDYILPEPAECGEFTSLTENMDSQEGVRYKMNTITCLLVKRMEDGSYATYHGTSIHEDPTPDEKTLISRQKITLYYTQELANALRDQDKPKWKEYFYEELMIADADGGINLGDSHFQYSSDNGLRRIK